MIITSQRIDPINPKLISDNWTMFQRRNEANKGAFRIPEGKIRRPVPDLWRFVFKTGLFEFFCRPMHDFPTIRKNI